MRVGKTRKSFGHLSNLQRSPFFGSLQAETATYSVNTPSAPFAELSSKRSRRSEGRAPRSRTSPPSIPHRLLLRNKGLLSSLPRNLRGMAASWGALRSSYAQPPPFASIEQLTLPTSE